MATTDYVTKDELATKEDLANLATKADIRNEADRMIQSI